MASSASCSAAGSAAWTSTYVVGRAAQIAHTARCRGATACAERVPPLGTSSRGSSSAASHSCSRRATTTHTSGQLRSVTASGGRRRGAIESDSAAASRASEFTSTGSGSVPAAHHSPAVESASSTCSSCLWSISSAVGDVAASAPSTADEPPKSGASWPAAAHSAGSASAGPSARTKSQTKRRSPNAAEGTPGFTSRAFAGGPGSALAPVRFGSCGSIASHTAGPSCEWSGRAGSRKASSQSCFGCKRSSASAFLSARTAARRASLSATNAARCASFSARAAARSASRF